MMEKEWRTCRLTVNGLVQKARYNEQTIEGLFLPLLRRLTGLFLRRGQRVVAFLAAPPGTGKSTLGLLLEKLSQTSEGIAPVQVLGLDGFHYHADYIASHTVWRGGEEIPMREVKGCPETFDVDHLIEKLAHIREGGIRWPVYDRARHDVIEDIMTVRKPIVLLEGNWLLLGDERWRELRHFADYTILVTARPSDLRERLIARKVQGGMERAAAEAFYEASDRPNVERVLKDSWPADETWVMLADGDYQLRPKQQMPTNAERAALWKKPQVNLEDPYLLRMMNERLAALPADGTGDIYAQGFVEGLSKARVDIIRRLAAGGMERAALKKAFDLTDADVAELLSEQEE